jgi:ribosomal protein S18 acetylase RimI-like enzyme
LVEVVQVTLANAGLLDRLAADVFDYPITPQRLLSYLGQPNHVLFVAVHKGVVIGHVRGAAIHHPDKAPDVYIDNLGVTPDWRRQRIGLRLVQALTGWARRLGCESVWLAAEPDDATAIAFYDAAGFARRPVSYHSTDLGPRPG